ncbi:cystathionine beta-lyase [Vibrio maritimus]|uniref:Cystathionine beta-lyase n=1 Tax=Vibrio maritimus TaxID=990268 RepID=A0A090T1W0_9VIBR|nr:cystathionine beta-lyase [Vibrio maritimus]
MSESKTTKFVTAGRDKKWTNGVVNPPVQRASTVVFDTVAEKHHATVNRANKTLFYGRRGTNTHFAFQDAMTEIEGGVGCALYHVAQRLSLMRFLLLLRPAIIFSWSTRVTSLLVTSVTAS